MLLTLVLLSLGTLSHHLFADEPGGGEHPQRADFDARTRPSAVEPSRAQRSDGNAEAAQPAGRRLDPKLQWRNGDAITGRMVGADTTHLRWRSPQFAEPMSIDMTYLDAVDFPSETGMQHAGDAEAAPVRDPMQFLLVDGSALYGRLVNITDQHIEVHSERHGQFRLLRSAVRSFQQLKAPTFIYQGPNGTSGWRSINRNQLSQWQTGPDGQLTSRTLGAELYRDFDIASTVEIELWLQWNQRPGFVIALGTAGNGTIAMEDVKVETWGQDLVLQSLGTVGDFAQIAALDERDGSLRIRLVWDRLEGRMSVYSLDGERLATLATGKAGNDNSGIYIQNKGADLTVDRVRISQARQPVPSDLEEGQVLVHLVDNSTMRGVVTGFDEQEGALHITESSDGQDTESDAQEHREAVGVASSSSAGEQRRVGHASSLSAGEHRIPVDQIAGVFLTSDRTEPSPAATAQVSFRDGTLLRGRIESIEEGDLTLKTDYAREPIVSQLNGIRQLRFLPPEQELESPPAPHVLEFPGGTLRGSLGPSGNADLPFAWQPVGAAKPVPLRNDSFTRIIWNERDGANVELHEAADLPDRLYLTSGDIVPCRIEAVDETHVYMESPITETTRIPREQVKTMGLGSEGRTIRGFGGNAWQVIANVAGAVERTDEKVVFYGPGQLSHTSPQGYQRLQFRVRWHEGNVNPALQLSSPGVGLTLFFSGTQVQVHGRGMGMMGMGGIGGGGEAFVQADGGLVLRARRIEVDGRVVVEEVRNVPQAAAVRRVAQQREAPEAEVTLVFDQNLTVLVDGEPVYRQERLTVPQPERSQIDVRFLGPRREGDEPQALLTLSDFRADTSAVSVETLSLDREQEQLVLTVPRHRRDNPPTHVLVAGTGDLLRGRFVGMDENEVHFISRLNDVRVPRERLVGIIRLDPIDDDHDVQPAGEPIDDENRVQAQLGDGSAFTFTPQQVAGERLIGHSETLGRCTVPLDAIHWLSFNRYGNEGAQLFSQWRLRPATEPQFAGGGTAGDPAPLGGDSPLVGTVAEPFTADLLDGGTFRLNEHSGRIVVLDFWATWCGHCIRAMPGLIEAVGEFPEDQVLLVAVNQKENAETVERFLDNRGWDLTVALDPEGQIGGRFHVDALPQTVIIGPGGKIERLHVGAHPDFPGELRRVLKEFTDAR